MKTLTTCISGLLAITILTSTAWADRRDALKQVQKPAEDLSQNLQKTAEILSGQPQPRSSPDDQQTDQPEHTASPNEKNADSDSQASQQEKNGGQAFPPQTSMHESPPSQIKQPFLTNSITRFVIDSQLIAPFTSDLGQVMLDARYTCVDKTDIPPAVLNGMRAAAAIPDSESIIKYIGPKYDNAIVPDDGETAQRMAKVLPSIPNGHAYILTAEAIYMPLDGTIRRIPFGLVLQFTNLPLPSDAVRVNPASGNWYLNLDRSSPDYETPAARIDSNIVFRVAGEGHGQNSEFLTLSSMVQEIKMYYFRQCRLHMSLPDTDASLSGYNGIEWGTSLSRVKDILHPELERYYEEFFVPVSDFTKRIRTSMYTMSFRGYEPVKYFKTISPIHVYGNLTGFRYDTFRGKYFFYFIDDKLTLIYFDADAENSKAIQDYDPIVKVMINKYGEPQITDGTFKISPDAPFESNGKKFVWDRDKGLVVMVAGLNGKKGVENILYASKEMSEYCKKRADAAANSARQEDEMKQKKLEASFDEF
jgi:hypothetical protein